MVQIMGETDRKDLRTFKVKLDNSRVNYNEVSDVDNEEVEIEMNLLQIELEIIIGP